MSRYFNAILLLIILMRCDDNDNGAFDLSSMNGDYKGPCTVSTSYTSGDILVDTLEVTISAVAHETKDITMYLTI